MRIAVVTEVFLPAVDGVVTRLRHTLAELTRAGDEVMVVAPEGGPPSYAGAVVVDMPALRVPLYPDGDGYPEKRVSLPGRPLGRALRLFRPDVIHAVNPVLLAAGAVYYARRLRVPLVASYHANLPAYAGYYGLGMLEAFGWRYIRTLHNRADLNLCTSQATMRRLTEQRFERLAFWPYGIEPGLLDPDASSSAARARLSGGHPERKIMLFVGRLAKEKGIERLLPAVRELDGVALAIVGDGPLRTTLQRQFAGTSTTFLGLLTGEELVAAYSSADMFVFPSRTETLGMVMLEAHAAGLPVLAADSAAARELVNDGVDGLRFDPAVPRSLIAAIRRVVEDESLRRMMAREARRSVSGATWTAATRVLRTHYEAVRPVDGANEVRAASGPAPPLLPSVPRAREEWTG